MIRRLPSFALAKRHPLLFRTLATVAVLLLGIRFVGSPIATHVANRKLAALPEYTGRVENVYLSLWRGTISFAGLELSSRRAPEEGAVLRVGHASLTLSPGLLLRGELGGRARVDDSEIAILPQAIPDEAKLALQELDQRRGQRADAARRWQAILREAFPLELSRLEIRRLRVRYKDPSTQPPAELGLDDFHLVLAGLRNRPSGKNTRPARLDIEARFTGGGTVWIEASADPLARPPRFTAKMEVRELALPQMNSFARAYAAADITRGTFEVFAEIEAANGGYQGYVTPFFRDLEFEPVPDKSLVKRAAVAVADAVTHVLRNDDSEVATKIPFAGDFENTDVAVWALIESALRNAFIQSLREGLAGWRA